MDESACIILNVLTQEFVIREQFLMRQTITRCLRSDAKYEILITDLFHAQTFKI